MYESSFTNLINDWDKWKWNINEDVVMPWIAQHIREDLLNSY